MMRAWMMILLLLLAAARPAAGQSGDANDDQRIDEQDVSAIIDHALERRKAPGQPDTDADTVVGVTDAVRIGRTLAAPDRMKVLLPGGAALELVRIPAGRFTMGSAGDEGWDIGVEGPEHQVTFSVDSAFYLGKYEITQAQWEALMGEWPGDKPIKNFGAGPDYPAYNISWNDAQKFIAALNAHIQRTNQAAAGFRLPSEAEWEYACRAGSRERFCFGDSKLEPTASDAAGDLGEHAWFAGNNKSQNGAKPVGARRPNAFGLYDMHGNVFEWCQDTFQPNYDEAPADGSAWEVADAETRVLRGGAWASTPMQCRSVVRIDYPADSRLPSVGFRVAYAAK
ncbi:SUMF1/EgtB/PvdO family nonheme iron enzyme [Candidatus Sumerlaeota bacterium]|nr:SUMF1/EgtB/PvdO family nonheme iron enzyme [Candidatus Sumerlaeota bacterium]